MRSRAQLRRADISIALLVQIVIVACLALFLVIWSVQIGLIGRSGADLECATSVETARQANRFGNVADLSGCETRKLDATGLKDEQVASRLLAEYHYCEDSFKPESGYPLFDLERKEATFCHVCAVIRSEDELRLPEGIIGDEPGAVDMVRVLARETPATDNYVVPAGKALLVMYVETQDVEGAVARFLRSFPSWYEQAQDNVDESFWRDILTDPIGILTLPWPTLHEDFNEWHRETTSAGIVWVTQWAGDDVPVGEWLGSENLASGIVILVADQNAMDLQGCTMQDLQYASDEESQR